MTTSTLLPHDLVWLADAPGFARVNALPEWASAAWLACAPLVVRRDGASDARIPVGLRGTTRAQRHAAWLPAAQVARVVTPGMIARQARWRDHPRRAALPALVALARVAPLLDAAQANWGVTGGVGFTLASGIDVLHPGSDLDLLVTAATPLPAELARTLAALLDDAQVRIDIQVATPFGAFALRERVRTGGRVLLKTAIGPVMSQDPWQPQP
ncbi:malonate decarboxylase holo-ACP synthase [Cupriavidus sp. CV2]|uniref:malonate decarboxylase holo-ACP synthase n=1 Tax=Cupriavidus ulmosensis TaxID=3065913 RepID=UPI00296B210D|nr:malonate decarboxylase holo-ACP synthase [Cupriavidus sp. CV2]MDW3687430.1 malonate decarboxylase holo-ACP synthase [Cupriavidus sp. CV2]